MDWTRSASVTDDVTGGVTGAVVARMRPGMEVCDVDGHKIGSVAHVYEGAMDPTGRLDGYIEVKTGFFGLGKHLFVPFAAVREVTEGGIILSTEKSQVDSKGWERRPDDLGAARSDVVHPTGRAADTVHPSQTSDARDTSADAGSPQSGPSSVASSTDASSAGDDWNSVAPHYRARWQAHYGALGVNWERYEPRYRFAWEMGSHPDFKEKSWVMAQSGLRQHWETLHPTEEWDTVSDTIRDAWEHPADSRARIEAGQFDQTK